MTLGEKLKMARLAAGLSQRQLCGDTITRNMLSQIENGAARPSMDTLSYLAGRLGKPISFFLEEAEEILPNLRVIAAARDAWQAGDANGVLTALKDYQKPDTAFDGEYGLLWNFATLEKAVQALAEGRKVYAAALLERLENSPYECLLEEKTALTRWKIEKNGNLPNIDPLLMAKAEQAMEKGEPHRAQALLDACEEKSPVWHLLRGEAAFLQGDYTAAAEHFRTGEDSDPDVTIPWLEECYKALGDYKMAYEYACKRRIDR